MTGSQWVAPVAGVVPDWAWRDVEALRPDGTPEPSSLTVTRRPAAFEPGRIVRVLVEGEEVFRGPVEPWPQAPDVTVMPADQFDELVETLDQPDEAPALREAWWRRMFGRHG